MASLPAGFEIETTEHTSQALTLPEGFEIEPPFDLESFDPAGEIAANPPLIAAKEPGILDQIGGIAEAGATLVTGATGGTIGLMGGTLEQVSREARIGEFGTPKAASRIEENALKRAAQLTNLPESELGKKRLGQLGELLGPLAALPPLIPELGAIGVGLKSAAPAARQAADKTAGVVNEATRLVRDRFKNRADDLGLSVGAREVPIADLRQIQADELPVPISLTEGQRTRDFQQVRFEQETAKMGDEGSPLRARFEQQNMQIQQNIDAFIDETGGTAATRREIGESVGVALTGKIKKDKQRIRRLFEDAEESGGMDQKVDVDVVADHLNKNRAEREENGIMQKVQRQVDALEIGTGNFADGSLEIRDITLVEAESLRRFINKNIRSAEPNDIRIGANIKRLIDESTEGLGNEKFKAARKARRKFAEDFEGVALMKQLTGLRKGTEERAVALEDVLRKSVISPSSSMDSLKKLRRVLQNGGDDGKQAWKDIHSGTLQHIQDEMIKNVATNQRGERVVSPAKLDKVIRDLDSSGKLDLIFGFKGAEKLRTINDVAKTVLTAPPGTINTSNTATVLAGLMDVGLTGATGVPLPILTAGKLITKSLKDKKLKKRVDAALRLPNSK